MTLSEVESARVHITFPRDSVFLESQQPGKASIIVRLRPGAYLSKQNVAAITNLAASAVEGLAPEAVSVIDGQGNLLNRPRAQNAEADGQPPDANLDYKQKIEADLLTKVNATLEPLARGRTNFARDYGRLRLHPRPKRARNPRPNQVRHADVAEDR